MKKILLLFVLMFGMIYSYAQPSAAEYSALIDFYNSTGGPNWTNKSGWSTANPVVVESVAGWYGVQTDAAGHVTMLDLDGIVDFTYVTENGQQVYPGNNLTGNLPPSIGNLSWLRALNVGGNMLSGSIPEEIGNLTELVWLVASRNRLTGSLPSSIGNLTNLDRILLEYNMLSGSIPSSIGNCVNLWSLLLNNNQLTGSIPSTIGNLTSIRYFHLHFNQLSGTIPVEIGDMTNVWQIGLHGNQLTGTIPSSFGNLQFIFGLYLHSNRLTGSIPETLANMGSLQVLYLGLNELNGVVPPEIGSMPSLNNLYLGYNKFTFSDVIELKTRFQGTFTFGRFAFIDSEKTLLAESGGSVTLSTSIDRNTNPASIYQWFKRDAITTNTIPVNSPSTSGHTIVLSNLSEADDLSRYFYKITNPAFPGEVETSYDQQIKVNYTRDLNYVRTIDVAVEHQTETSQVENLTLDQRVITYSYLDGLGRPIQTVSQQASPAGFDVVVPIQYDEFGRERMRYLPIVTGASGSYKINEVLINEEGNYTGAAESFYGAGGQNNVIKDTRPFSETIFEASPLNRPEKEYGPGQAWAPVDKGGANKFIQHKYLTNRHNLIGSDTEEKVIAWKLDEAGMPGYKEPVAGYIESGGYYSSSQLHIKVTLDEQGNAVREYTNKEGQVILKKVQAVAGSANLNDIDQWACTYYIYDDLNNLVVVLPPEGVKQLLSLQN